MRSRAPGPASTTGETYLTVATVASINLRALAPIGVFFLLCIVIAVFSPNFLSVSNAIRILNASAIPVVLVMGATFVILMGSIDLSVEGIVALCAVVTASLVLNDTTPANLGLWAIPFAVLAGGLIGAVNGATHVYLKVPSFMVTLGIGFVCLGIATAALGGFPVRISDRGFRALTLGRTLGLPNGIWVAAAAVVVALIIQERTRLGRYVYAIGTDEITARQSGVPVERTRVLVFVLAGLFSGLAGAMAAAQLGQGHALIASGRLFTTITAVVVGGTALSGGVGSVLNSVVGVLIVVVLTNGMVLMGVPPFVQQGVQGFLIIIAVSLALDRRQLEVVK